MPENGMLLIIIGVVAVVFVVVIANARIRRPRRTATGTALSGSDATIDPPVEERLSRLADLRSKGLVDEHEYESERRKILGEF